MTNVDVMRNFYKIFLNKPELYQCMYVCRGNIVQAFVVVPKDIIRMLGRLECKLYKSYKRRLKVCVP